jgi:8-oxo-dGTP pyrophosphatase MutT (NUDIX family)
VKLLLVVAAALVDVDDRVLIAQRPEGKALAGLWEFPGGKLDANERPEDALIRELREELGIVVKPACLAPLTFASHAYDDFHLLIELEEPHLVDARSILKLAIAVDRSRRFSGTPRRSPPRHPTEAIMIRTGIFALALSSLSSAAFAQTAARWQDVLFFKWVSEPRATRYVLNANNCGPELSRPVWGPYGELLGYACYMNSNGS